MMDARPQDSRAEWVLSPENAGAFLARFQHFYDGLLRGVGLHFQSPETPRYSGEYRGVWLECSVIDAHRTTPGDRINVALNVEQVEAMRLTLGRYTAVVLSEGLSIGFFDQDIYLAFDAEARTREEFLGAQFFLVGKRCTCSLLPYREAPPIPSPDTL